ncbi:hypothetical protein Nepgr_016236 [Nepenthes gracilis]|uniref:Methyltransferase type 11 domain-containing protein n=1 Tax=Nepenthes gracilis TaxID=150966 RepID=A0AAD3SPB5_NEPGR|nr:hypothetical protein Nepgr_016236 [Nepenthes gracilis]
MSNCKHSKSLANRYVKSNLIPIGHSGRRALFLSLCVSGNLSGGISRENLSAMGKASRNWAQIYAIYGMHEWQTLIFLLINAIFFSLLSVLFLMHFPTICAFFDSLSVFSALPAGSARFGAGFIGSVTALSAVSLFFVAGNFLYSSIPLRWAMSQRIVNVVNDWSNVKTALDVGCGRGVLLNAVAMQLKKEGSCGRVVGLDQKKALTMPTLLRTARVEGVQEYVTCREADVRQLPFGDNYFDVVVSAVFLHTVGKEFGQRTAAAAAERMRVLVEEIRVSERVTAFMASSHIVSFRKPSQQLVGPLEVLVDWRFTHNVDMSLCDLIRTVDSEAKSRS